ETPLIQNTTGNINEKKTLINPLIKETGEKVKTLLEWEAQRDYLKNILIEYQYGSMPSTDLLDTVYVLQQEYKIDGTTRDSMLLLTFHLIRDGKTASIRAGLVIPKQRGSKTPVIIKNDDFIFSLNDIKSKRLEQLYADNHRDEINNYSIRKATEKGYSLLKFIRTDVASDSVDSRQTGVYRLFPEYNWGTIAAWAWMYQVIINWLENQDFADMDRIVVTGHSRGGKAALCAAIFDNRIDLTVPNASGTGGTGSWQYSDKHHSFESIDRILKYYEYWWSPNLDRFRDDVSELPFDAHFNKALIAPRALLNTGSREDYWSNPFGTYLTHLAAMPFFEAYGVSQNLGVKWRNGAHNQDSADWDALFKFSDKLFFNKQCEIDFNESPFSEYEYDAILTPYLKDLDGFSSIIFSRTND
ncbi:MAG: hypothetical protein JW731_09325, partial [Bacteroidales bacterium]|nr:hypothetical protein [Bacteroidales bacterium]